MERLLSLHWEGSSASPASTGYTLAMISSRRNQNVAYLRRIQGGKSRREERAFLVEGTRLALEALTVGWPLVAGLYDRNQLERTPLGTEVLKALENEEGVLEATPDVIEAAADTRSPQGVVLAFRQPEVASLGSDSQDRWLVILDQIADAGNAGTIMRTAWASGAPMVVFAGHGVDPWNAKVVRAAMGAHFHIDVVEAGWEEIAERVSPERPLYAADSSAGAGIYEVDWTAAAGVVFGSEAHGLSTDLPSTPIQRVRIPMAPGVDSLNVSAAAAIILFHAARARSE